MDAFLAVLQELWTFAFRERFGFRNVLALPEERQLVALPSAPLRPLLGGARIAVREDEGGEPCYIAVPETRVHAQPARAFDNVLGTLAYATKVVRLETSESGRWCRIRYANGDGWVMREHTVANRRELEPQLQKGVRYDAYHPETAKLRAMIGDMFALEGTAHDLADVEYVTYQLAVRGIQIDWPQTRPRLAGLWHTILKGEKRVHMGVLPVPHAIIEYATENGMGHVAFVEAIFPDEAIHISEVGHPEDGIYGERTLSHEEWREYRPVFIEVR